MIASEHRLALPAGYQLGKYLFKGVLGAGGFGITYLADDPTLGRRVAIKELLPNEIATRLDGTTVVAKTKTEESSLAWARERFVEEGRALAACEHPNVVHVYEMIEANGTAYMVTKYEDGRSMAEWLTNLGRKPTEAELRGLLEPMLSGLEKVHKAGFLHRDIKPENIYITDDGRPLLLDFGSARQAVSDRSALLTSIVTIGYAPFEQYYEDGKQGPWTDIYALGGVMYRAIHGEKPPEATRRIKNDTCVKLGKKYAGHYAAQFLNAIDRALSVEYQDRPQSVIAWRGFLGKGAVVTQETLSISQKEIWLQRLRHAAEVVFDHPKTTASAAAVGVLFCGLALWKAISPTPRPDPVPDPKPSPVAEVTPPPNFKSDNPPSPGPVAFVTPAPETASPPFPGTTPARTGVDNWVPGFNPNAAAGPTVDPKIVGTWTTKAFNAGGSVTLKWELLEDGRYSLTRAGGPPETGTITAQGGLIHLVSMTSAGMTKDLPYEIKPGSKLQTTGFGDPGAVIWTKVSGGTGSKSGTTTHTRGGNNNTGNNSNSNNNDSSSKVPTWLRYMPQSAPSRAPFPMPRPF